MTCVILCAVTRVLSDWDSGGHGPREQDIVPASILHRFGRPPNGS